MDLFDFHIHSHFSKDSNMTPRNIVKVAKKNELRGIAITDHETIRGGVEAKKESPHSDFFIIVGSEIRTEACEIIGLFLNEEVSSTDPYSVIDEIRDQGGLAVLPHPFRSLPAFFQKRGKIIPEEIVKRIHFIEVINSRTREKDNQKALTLASRMGKPMVTGSDAHFYQEIGRVKTSLAPFNSEEELRKNLLEGKTIVELKHNLFLKSIPFILLSGLYERTRKV
ncbi:MAG: PHP domain-containing protein [Candidatus Bathyarchaeota archaeon]